MGESGAEEVAEIPPCVPARRSVPYFTTVPPNRIRRKIAKKYIKPMHFLMYLEKAFVGGATPRRHVLELMSPRWKKHRVSLRQFVQNPATFKQIFAQPHRCSSHASSQFMHTMGASRSVIACSHTALVDHPLYCAVVTHGSRIPVVGSVPPHHFIDSSDRQGGSSVEWVFSLEGDIGTQMNHPRGRGVTHPYSHPESSRSLSRK